MMQQVIAFVDPETQLKREQAFQARLERDMDHRLQETTKDFRTALERAEVELVVTRHELAWTTMLLKDANGMLEAVSTQLNANHEQMKPLNERRGDAEMDR
jgi:formyltetrahydrofolate hydrolase